MGFIGWLLLGQAASMQIANSSLQRELYQSQNTVLSLQSQKSQTTQQLADLQSRLDHLEHKRQQDLVMRYTGDVDADPAPERLIARACCRRKLHQQVLDLKGNIRVFCRLRPPSSNTPDDELPNVVACDSPLAGPADADLAADESKEPRSCAPT